MSSSSAASCFHLVRQSGSGAISPKVYSAIRLSGIRKVVDTCLCSVAPSEVRSWYRQPGRGETRIWGAFYPALVQLSTKCVCECGCVRVEVERRRGSGEVKE